MTYIQYILSTIQYKYTLRYNLKCIIAQSVKTISTKAYEVIVLCLCCFISRISVSYDLSLTNFDLYILPVLAY
jgi:hypothetical protein